MKTIYFPVLIIIFLCNISSQVLADGNITAEKLPVYPPRVQAFRKEDGKLLTKPRLEPKLELKHLVLNVKKDSDSATGYAIPKTVPEASQMLRQALPAGVYERLMDNYKEMATTGMSTKDEALDERFWDLAIFFYNAWDLKNNKYLIKEPERRYDFYESFEGMLDAIKEKEVK